MLSIGHSPEFRGDRPELKEDTAVARINILWTLGDRPVDRVTMRCDDIFATTHLFYRITITRESHKLVGRSEMLLRQSR